MGPDPEFPSQVPSTPGANAYRDYGNPSMQLLCASWN